MATKQTTTVRNNRSSFTFALASLFTLLITCAVLVGSLNLTKVVADTNAVSESDSWPQQQSSSPTPEFLGRSDSSPPIPNTSSSATSSATSGSQVYIGFDVYPSGAPVRHFDPISNQYPPAIFSSDFYHYPLADSQNWGTSLPNSLGRAPKFGFYNGTGYADLYVDFTTPVNNLRFYIDAVDEFRQGIAQLNIFQNNQLAATRNIDGWGTVFRPIPIDVGGMGFNNVTRIEIKNINDYKGVGFDDFSFTLAPTPSPTPTPQPTPPAPAGLSATVNDRQVRLNWTGSSGAAGYYVKRSTTNGGQYTTLSAPQNPTYLDPTPSGDTTYFYVVSAFNNAGESPHSNQVSVSIPSACGNQPGITQSPGRIQSTSGWGMTVEVSGNDGVVLRDVSLNGRYMARSISLPYFTVETTKTSGRRRGELKPNGSDATLRSRLVKVDAFADIQNPFLPGTNIVVLAEYVVDRITPTSDSCLRIWQEYVFAGKEMTKNILGKPCEPSGTVPCAAYFPTVRYRFESRNDEVLLSFNAIQRNQFWVNGLAANAIGIFRDCDLTGPCTVETDYLGLRASAFARKENPLKTELKGHLLTRGEDSREWDNIHQTYNSKIEDEPGVDLFGPNSRYYLITGGCPECLHMHWRWGSSIPSSEYGNGSVRLYYPDTNQDLDFAVVKYKHLEQENAEPLDYAALADRESIRLGTTVGDQVLVYYSATGRRQTDSFFHHLYFFNPDFGSGTRPIQRHSPNSSSSSTPTTEDGPISVSFPHIFQDDEVHFEAFDPNLVAPLPPGYVAYNGIGYNITTHAEVAGPYVVSFGVPSATDQSIFNSLRILHAEPDPLDPESGIWVDRTVVPPDSPALDFSAKIVNAKVNNFAGFVIARLVSPQPPSTATTDLAVSTSSSPDPVVAPNNLTYTITITNSGPDTATGAGLIDSLSSDVAFVSSSSTQGTCKFVDGSVYCKLGSLTSGASAVVTILVRPSEGGDRFPEEGKPILNTAIAMANQNDPNQDNNTFVNSNTALRDPNAPPTVSITSPANGARFVGPTNIVLTATASDSDGTIAQVDFYDGAILIGSGTPAGSNQYSLAWNNVSFGNHQLAAVATDNGGRRKASSSSNILVNGPATVNITSPASGSVIAPHSNIVVTANATISSGVITKVDYFANSILLGTVNGGGQPSLSWNDVPNGKYSITAIATDGSGVTTTSMPVDVVISNRPTISITGPQDGASFGTSPVVTFVAAVQDDDTILDKVTFLANGVPFGTGLRSGLDQFTFTWRGAPDGIFSITAVVTDQYGLTTTSAPITIGVNTPSPRQGEFVWFDDALPSGAVTPSGQEGWYWVDANPGAFSGTKSHQSRNFGQLEPPNSFHQHLFEGATTTFPVNVGDKLFTYVFLDINNMPREIMLQWKDANGWEHRAYWGANIITNLGTDGTNSRRYMGPLPRAGTWVRLEVPASLVGLEGATLNGMAFTLDGGRATFDLAGKTTANAPPPPTTPPGDFVWVDDAVPASSTLETVDDQWQWIEPHVCGTQGHRSHFSVNKGNGKFRSHSFRNAPTTMSVNPGDVLFAYVYLDANHMPDQLMLQWHDGTGWEHRAFWGENYIGQKVPNMGVQGTESQRYMGGIPPGNQWVRLEVPASYVGLEGKTVSGMAFGFYSRVDKAGINWDCSGKSPNLTTVPLPLSATSSVWRLYSNTYGWSYNTNDQGEPEHTPQKKDVFFVHPNEAAGTVPMHRFRKSGYEYFYHTCRTCPGSEWQYEGVAFYVFPPDAPAPGTVPLYLYHDNRSKYFLTVNQNEATGMNFDRIWAYVYAGSPLVPVSPYLHMIDTSCKLFWTDYASNETGFKVERRLDGETTWTQIAVVGANVTSYQSGCPSHKLGKPTHFRVRATNAAGDSEYSNEQASCVQSPCMMDGGQNSPPHVNIVEPVDLGVVGSDFAISANVFDADGYGTIAKVEFFANGNKLGEVWDAPYVFVWNNAPLGTYSLTAVATDAAGATGTSSPVSVNVGGSSNSRINVALASNGATVTAQNYTQDGVYPGYQFAPGYAIDGLRYCPLIASGNDVNKFWRDEHGLPSWLQITFAGNKIIDEVDVFTFRDFPAALSQTDPSSSETFSNYGTTAFDVQYWNGNAWEIVPGGSITGNNQVWTKISFMPITTSKIRIVVKAAVDSVARISEVEVWGIAAPTNVALASSGATVTAQNYTQDGVYPGYQFAPSYAIDGLRYCSLIASGNDVNKFWRDEHGLPSWLEVDFNGSKTIREIDVFTVANYPDFMAQADPPPGQTFTSYGVTAFDVQYWNGGAWVNIPGGSITGNNLVWRKVTFTPITTNKIRVVVNAAVDGVARISEVEAWTP